METKSLLAKEKSQENDSAWAGASQTQDNSKTLPLKLERLDTKRTMMGIMVKGMQWKVMGCSEMLLPSFCGLRRVQL